MAPRFPRKPLLRSLAVCAAVLALCAGSQLTAGAAHNTWALWSNETLTPGQFLSIGISGQNSGYRLELQTDGNLVLYRWNGKALWWTGTWGQSISHLVMQSDGNLVLYRTNGTAAWSSGTFGSGHRIELWPDGNLVMKNSANAAVWSTGTWENQQGGNLMTWCGFQANRTATIRVRKVLDNGAIANTRARQLVDFGAWYWNAAGTLSPQFQVVEPQSSGSEIESVIDTGLGLVYARADGARTALCPLPTQPANLTLRINTSILNTDALRRHVGPHEFGHYLGLSHFPDDSNALPAPYNSWDPVANPALCQYIPLMWPWGDHGAFCSRWGPVGVDLLRVPRVYN